MADANFIESCSACRFFLAPNGAIGVCRRYPTHQNRHGNDWCGEWTFKKTIVEITQEKIINEAFDEVYAKRSKEIAAMEIDKPKRGRKPKVQA
jgi:hypothetical protein